MINKTNCWKVAFKVRELKRESMSPWKQQNNITMNSTEKCTQETHEASLKRTNEAESLNWKTNMHQECSSNNVKHNVKYTSQCYRYTFSRFWIILHFTIWEQITVPSCYIVGQTLETNQELWIQKPEENKSSSRGEDRGTYCISSPNGIFLVHTCARENSRTKLLICLVKVSKRTESIHCSKTHDFWLNYCQFLGTIRSNETEEEKRPRELETLESEITIPIPSLKPHFLSHNTTGRNTRSLSV
jgi:hypothetical protein